MVKHDVDVEKLQQAAEAAGARKVEERLQAAEAAVTAIPPPAADVAPADALALAAAAVAALADCARRQIFGVDGDVVPVGSDALQDLAAYTEGARALECGPVIAALHHRALVTHPALARALRSQLVRSRVAAAASATAHLIARPEAEVVAEALVTYETAIALQLYEAEGSPWARVLGTETPRLVAQLAARRGEHAAFVAAELERVAQEQAAADVVLETVRQIRRAEQEAEATAHDMAAAASRAVAARERAEVLAARVEKRGTTLHVGSLVYATADLAAGLRRGDCSAARMDAVAAALDAGAPADPAHLSVTW